MNLAQRSLVTLAASIALVLAAYGGWSMATDAASAFAQEPERNELHERMHSMMDEMMGEGASERMHKAMPGSEEMMEECTSMMGMMDGGMMDDGMMRGGMMDGGMMRDGMMGQGMMSTGMGSER